MKSAYLGLGSNLGNRMAFLRGGRDLLISRRDIILTLFAGIYEAKAIGGPPESPSFLNTVLQIQTSLQPYELLEVCLEVEEQFGRTRGSHWAPRTMDIDILMYADLILTDERLTVPHPRLTERAFVLVPLSQIATDIMHPVSQKTIGELASECPGTDDVALVRTSW